MEQRDPTGLTDAVVMSQHEAAAKNDHVPELGPAAMISDATANPTAPKTSGAPQTASLKSGSAGEVCSHDFSLSLFV